MSRIKSRLRQSISRLDQRLQRSRNGSVLILVVVLLVLMALLGTAYLVTARNDRAATKLYDHNVQIDILLSGVEQMALAQITTSYQTPVTQRYTDWLTTGNSFSGSVDHTWLAARYPALIGQTPTATSPSPSETVGQLPTGGVPLYPVPTGVMVSVGTPSITNLYLKLSNPKAPTQNPPQYPDYNTNPISATTLLSPSVPYPDWVAISGTPLNSATAPVWPAVSAPLLSNAVFEDPRTASVRPDGARTFCSPTYITLNGTNYPALTYLSLYNSKAQGKAVVETAMAASASGDGIADSFLWRLPVGTIDGITYYAAVRIIDNSSQINLNTAMCETFDFTNGGLYDIGAVTNSSPAKGFAPPTFPGGIGLLELTNSFAAQGAPGGASAFPGTTLANPELLALNNFHFQGAQPNGLAPVPAAPPPTWPTDDNNMMRTDFVYRTFGDALHHIIGRRPLNPGYVSSGLKGQALSWSDAAALAYRYDLRNSTGTPCNSETYLSSSLWTCVLPSGSAFTTTWNPNGGLFQSTPWDPSQVGSATQGWFSNYVDTWVLPGTFANLCKNRRPYFTTHNPVSNLMPVRTITDGPNGTSGLAAGQLTIQAQIPVQPNVFQDIVGSGFSWPSYGNALVIPKVSLNTADVTMLDYVTFNTPAKTPTLWFGFYNAMMDALSATTPGSPMVGNVAIPPILISPAPNIQFGMPLVNSATPVTIPTGAPGYGQFRSPIRDLNGFGSSAASSTSYLTGPETVLLRSLLAACNAKDLRDSGDNITPETIQNFPYGQNGSATVHAYGTERQVFITEVYANTETAPSAFVGKGQTVNNPNYTDPPPQNPNGYVAVQLYNPYDYPVDLTWWTLAVVTRSGTPQTLSVKSITAFKGFGNDGQTTTVVAPHSYLVLENIYRQPASDGPQGSDATYRPYTAYGLTGGSATPVTPPGAHLYYVPNLHQALAGELVLLRQIYAQPRHPNNTDPTPLAAGGAIPVPTLVTMPPADAFDFTGTNGGKNQTFYAVHYVRPNPGNQIAPVAGVNPTAWKFVYPGRWDPKNYSPYYEEGLSGPNGHTSWTAPDPTTLAQPQPNNSYDPWQDAMPAPNLAFGQQQSQATYLSGNSFPPIQLNNTDFGGPSKTLAATTAGTLASQSNTPYQFPFGGFTRVGDVLQVPFIGAYIIIGPNNTVLEMNPVTRDCATADDNDGGSDDKYEQVGRFCPLLASMQIAAGVESPAGIIQTYPANTPNAGTLYDPYGWAGHLFEYFSAQNNPNDDYLPNIDPVEYAYGPWIISPVPVPTYNYNSVNNPGNAYVKNQFNGIVNTINSGNGPNAGNEDLVGVEGLININTVNWRVMAAVPWIPTSSNTGTYTPALNAQLAQAILQYRNTYGAFKSPFDLNRVWGSFSTGTTFSFQGFTGDPSITDFKPLVGDFSPLPSSYFGGTPPTISGYFGLNIPPGDSDDNVTNDFETRFGMMVRASNVITTRSDTFTVYVLVQGWSGVGTGTPQLVVQRRGAFIVDRTQISPTNSTPNVINLQTN